MNKHLGHTTLQDLHQILTRYGQRKNLSLFLRFFLVVEGAPEALGAWVILFANVAKIVIKLDYTLNLAAYAGKQIPIPNLVNV